MKTKLIFLGFLCLCATNFSFSLPVVHYDTIYSDTFNENWWDDTWGNDIAFNTESNTNPYQGSHCIELDYSDWGSYGFDHREQYWSELYYFYPNQYQYVNFWFNPGNEVNQIQNVAVTLDLGESVRIVDYINESINANTWYNVRIPVHDLNPDNKRFFRVYFSNESNSLLPHIYIDNIFLEYYDDNIPPLISDFNVSEVEQDMAMVSWKTDEPSTYILTYREMVGGIGEETLASEDYQVGGTLSLMGLKPNTAYEIEIECKDHQRDPDKTPNSSSLLLTFATTAPDTLPPVISNLQVSDVYSNRVVISWNTDEPATTHLDYGINGFSKAYHDSLFSRVHTVVLTHLRDNEKYQFRVSSTDKKNNINFSNEDPLLKFTTSVKTESPDRWIVTDHPIYQWDEVGPDEVPWKWITHLNLGQLWPVPSDSGYTLGIEPDSYWANEWGGFSKWETEARKFIVSGHKANRHVICMLGGAGSNPAGQWNDATSSENIKKFAQNIRIVLEGIGFDGTDIDWEDDIDFTSFINLAKELRAAWPNAIITIPTGFNGDDATLFAPAKDYVNAFTPMSYYPIPQWGGWLIPVPITPLYPAGDNPYGIEYTRDKWIDAGVPSSKIIMGVGGFGCIWGDSNEDGLAPVRPYVNTDNLNGDANSEAEPMGGDNLVTWSFVHNVLQANPKLYEGWDETGHCSYWSTGDSSKQIKVLYPGRSYSLSISMIFYESARSMSDKVEYIENNNMKGVGYWTLSQLIHNGNSPVLDVASCLLMDTSHVDDPTDTSLIDIKGSSARLNIEVFPNPVKSELHIENIDPGQHLEMKIIDNLGRIVHEQKLLQNKNIIEFQGNKGFYILQITDQQGNTVESRKIFKL